MDGLCFRQSFLLQNMKIQATDIYPARFVTQLNSLVFPEMKPRRRQPSPSQTMRHSIAMFVQALLEHLQCLPTYPHNNQLLPKIALRLRPGLQESAAASSLKMGDFCSLATLSLRGGQIILWFMNRSGGVGGRVAVTGDGDEGSGKQIRPALAISVKVC